MAFEFFRKRSNRVPSLDDGDRVYAVGDIHGRYDLFERMLEKLERHNARSGVAGATHMILLGDLIDRGPESHKVLAHAKAIHDRTENFVVLMGNHELLMVKALEGFPGMLNAWRKSGGDATLRSFGIDPDTLGDNPIAAANKIAERIPEDIVSWLSGLPLTARSGDYLFCHAGVRPGVPLKAQKPDDLMWIRREFLEDERDHGAMIVHGHSIETDVQIRHNRIGIDTGAYRSGLLTALYLEGTSREVIGVRDGVTAVVGAAGPTAEPPRPGRSSSSEGRSRSDGSDDGSSGSGEGRRRRRSASDGADDA